MKPEVLLLLCFFLLPVVKNSVFARTISGGDNGREKPMFAAVRGWAGNTGKVGTDGVMLSNEGSAPRPGLGIIASSSSGTGTHTTTNTQVDVDFSFGTNLSAEDDDGPGSTLYNGGSNWYNNGGGIWYNGGPGAGVGAGTRAGGNGEDGNDYHAKK